MKKFLPAFLALLFYANNFASAASSQYPNLSGQVLFELKSDQKLKSQKTGISNNNTYINIEPDFSLNLNKQWSVKTGWRIFPVNKRSDLWPERSRTILAENRGFNQDNTGIIVEELKAFFQNDDMKFFAGKYNPTFATMYRKTKRIGVFVTDFTEDYELREKIGLGAAALLEDSEITVNTFFNDITGLSASGLTNRGREKSSGNLAGNTATLSSYTVTMEGQSLFGLHDLFYNIGYRNLGVDSNEETKREVGYTANLEYLYKFGNDTSLIPLIEVVKIKNFTGRTGRDAKYVTTSLIGKYNNWTTSVTQIFRNIDDNYDGTKNRDRQLQLNVGYKFTNNIALDVSRVNLKEDGYKAILLGAMLSYVYKF